MLNVREPTGAPLMNPNSNGATSRSVLYQNVLQYVNDLQHAAYRLRHIEHERAHGRAAPESQQQCATSRPVLYYRVLQSVHDLESTTHRLSHVQRERAHGRAAHDSR